MTDCQFSTKQAVETLLARLPEADSAAMESAAAHQAQLTKPPKSLGRLEDLAIFLSGWHGTAKPQITHPLCLIFAGNHGVARRGVSAFPPEVTAQMVANFHNGGAAINQLTQAAGATLAVHPIDLDTPTQDFTLGPAMTMAEMLAAMQIGADAVSTKKTDIVLLGEMGIGNSTVAAALAAAVLGGEARDWIGTGTGVDGAGLGRKETAITQALTTNAAHLGDGLSIMAALGGRELAAIAGAVLAARLHRIPVLIDGFIATAATLPLFLDNPDILAHCLISHCSAEPGHRAMLARLGKTPLLDLGLRLGEGSGAALALPIVVAAAKTHSTMATFNEAQVSQKEG